MAMCFRLLAIRYAEVRCISRMQPLADHSVLVAGPELGLVRAHHHGRDGSPRGLVGEEERGDRAAASSRVPQGDLALNRRCKHLKTPSDPDTFLGASDGRKALSSINY